MATVTILGPEYTGDPEAVAMLQAFYSRSFMPIQDRVADLGGDLTSVKKSLERVYLGYGHASVGDLGDAVIFIEGCSILAAKVIQNNPLYNGQESSTRYLDFHAMGTYVPDVPEEVSTAMYALQTMAIGVYDLAVADVVASLTAGYAEEWVAMTDDERKLAEKAVRARAFDICRCLLPAGAKTNLSWKTSLRKANELTASLMDHPLSEVRQLAVQMRVQLRDRFPSAISDVPVLFNPSVSDYYISDQEAASLRTQFLKFSDVADRDPESLAAGTITAVEVLYRNPLVLDALPTQRQKYQPVSRQVASALLCRFDVLMDYGSYRDVQRHRNGYLTFPLLTTEYGFHGWYMTNLILRLQSKTYKAVEQYLEYVRSFERQWPFVGPFDTQYVIPLGFRVAFSATWALDQMTYFAELRSGETVHPTVRPMAQTVGLVLRDRASQLRTYVNMDDDPGISFRRGSQDIVFK